MVCFEDKCKSLTYWDGAVCETDEGVLRAYFEVPRGGNALKDFYRLPWPNDIRLNGGKVDLSGHPNPALALPVELRDVVTSYLDAIEADVGGFGVNTAAFLRLSRLIDYTTVTVSAQGNKGPTVQFYNIDPKSAQYGNPVGLSMFASSNRGKYICDNWISVKPTLGRPLEAGTTYAVMLRGGIKDKNGTPVVQDDDFKLVLAESEPTDSELKTAWLAYAPLRAYLKDKQIEGSTVLSAAVFSTMTPRTKMAKFRSVVRARPDPSAVSLVHCDGAKKSPCEDGKDTSRACGATPSGAFDELHGVYKTPVFQAGTKPYLAPADGGSINYDAEGKPIVAGQDDACFALTLPKAPMPPSGWPVLIYAHGTGGNFRSFVENGTAATMAGIKRGPAALAQMAVIGIDGGMHGPRRGSELSPDELFFNLRNPRAARDNVYQAAADKFQLVRLVETLDLDTGSSPTGNAVTFDKSKIYFLGHSQGTVEGIPFAAYEQKVQGLVLSGAGGNLVESVLNKTKPYNIAAAIQLFFADGRVTNMHPLLNLLQLFFEEVDALNYAQALYAVPETGVEAKHTFLAWGVADSYTPPITTQALGTAMAARLLDQPAERCGDAVCGFWSENCDTCDADCPPADTCEVAAKPYPLVVAPVKGNLLGDAGKKVTAVTVQYVSDGSYDDHFVLTQNSKAKDQTAVFFGTAAVDGTPTVE
jgi:predicted esterase